MNIALINQKLSTLTVLSYLKWTGTVLAMIGGLLVALNLGYVALGFLIWAISEILWLYVGIITKDKSLIWLQISFLAVDVIGIYRWAFIST